MFRLDKKLFIGFVTGPAYNHTKYVLLSNQNCIIQADLIHLHHNEYSQEFHYYSFAVKLDRCVGSCNTLNDLSDKICLSK